MLARLRELSWKNCAKTTFFGQLLRCSLGHSLAFNASMNAKIVLSPIQVPVAVSDMEMTTDMETFQRL